MAALADAGKIPTDPLWLPGLRPIAEDGHVALAIECLVKSAPFWLWHAAHGLYQWPLDAQEQYANVATEIPFYLLDACDEEKIADRFHDMLHGPLVTLTILVAKHLVTFSELPNNRLSVKVQNPAGTILADTTMEAT
jgi:hypothetical protein